MTKYRLEFQSSGEVIERDNISMKPLYDVAKRELRWYISHIKPVKGDSIKEVAWFYRWNERYGDWELLYGMFAHCYDNSLCNRMCINLVDGNRDHPIRLFERIKLNYES